MITAVVRRISSEYRYRDFGLNLSFTKKTNKNTGRIKSAAIIGSQSISNIAPLNAK
ncbi:hypothetical protein [Peijinzhouia sedimentorum]